MADAICPVCETPGVLIFTGSTSTIFDKRYRYERECVAYRVDAWELWAHGPVASYWVPGHWEKVTIP